MAGPRLHELGGVSDFAHADGYERVVLAHDPDAGLRAVVAIDSTVLGPAMGGLRYRHYGSLDDAVGEATRLAAAMTLKNAAAGLDLGGGKAVVVAEDPPPDRARLFRSFGQVVESLGGSYITAEDIGTFPEDMDVIAEETGWVVGRSIELGGHGDPSPSTAVTVHGAINESCRLAFGSPELAGRSVGIIGVGKVGSRLARSLAADGADLVLADVDGVRAHHLARELDARSADRRICSGCPSTSSRRAPRAS